MVLLALLLITGIRSELTAQAYTNDVDLDSFTLTIGTTGAVVSRSVRVSIYDTEIMTEYTCTEILLRPSPVTFLVPALPGTFDPGRDLPAGMAFRSAEPVDSAWAPWPRQEKRIGLTAYTWNQTRPDWPPSYYSTFDMTGGQSSFLIGFRITHTDGNHYGWLHLTRPAVTATNLFEFDSYAIHPVPEEPIRAGLPPPSPELTVHPGDALAGTAFVLRWPPGYSDNAGYRLESAESLDPDAEWIPVEGASGQHPVPAGITNRFFRLRGP